MPLSLMGAFTIIIDIALEVINQLNGRAIFPVITRKFIVAVKWSRLINSSVSYGYSSLI